MMTLARFLRDESGATAIEYGLIAASISAAIVTVIQGVGSRLLGAFMGVDPGLD